MGVVRSHWKVVASISSIVAVVLVQTLSVLLVTSVANGFTRTAVFVTSLPLVTVLICVRRVCRGRSGWTIVALSTAVSVGVIHLLRGIDSSWFLGPLPAGYDLAAYAMVGGITLAVAAAVVTAFSSQGRMRKARWVVLGLVATLLVSFGLLVRSVLWEPSPTDLLRTVAHLEQADIASSGMKQQLSVMLAICGREEEAERLSRWQRQSDARVTTHENRQLELSLIQPKAWRETIREIGDQEQIIIIMEAHNSPKHRRWIEQTLPILYESGFRDYAAEALSEPGESLIRRGYPTASTGFYVSDPHFGNVLRAAMNLKMNLHSYEHYTSNFAEREYEQAANLAALFAENPRRKLVVHAGYAHAVKERQGTGELLMAGHLWNMTGIEPFCIWQTWHSPEETEAAQLADLIEAGSREPIMLEPVPNNLRDPQFGFPDGGIDALVVHRPSEGGPAERAPEYSDRQRLQGSWDGNEWPVVVGAFVRGEPSNAIALDQIMLREGEREYALWVPEADYEIRVFGINGTLP
jgi:hypothetical protein